MRRDPRLHGLSSEHHQALVLARTIRRAFEKERDRMALAELVIRVWQRYLEELLPHFETEEELLLPGLDAAGERSLADRTLREHREMAVLLSRARRDDLDALRRFGELLEAHVRFEEREVFPACESRLDRATLDAVAARAPKAHGA